MEYDPVQIEIFKHLFASIAEEMGALLRKASYSPNIKERRDYSCALFNAQGDMIAQAAHIPVHLGSMPLSVKAGIDHSAATGGFHPGDVVILNDPYRGGTHLPDITLVSPVFIDLPMVDQSPLHELNVPILIGFVASRAHHADVGGITPGSMPIARELFQEGLIIPPLKLVENKRLNQGVWDLIMANVRTPEERAGDLMAQLASNQRGVDRLVEVVSRHGYYQINLTMQALLSYSERMTRKLIESLPDGSYQFNDYLDDDGIGDDHIPIRVTITIDKDEATVDFAGSAKQQRGSINAVYAITISAVYYVFRCLIDLDVPNNSGCLVPIHVIAPEGTVVNALPPAPVAGGNVETSQRIVDVLLGALAKACPERVPAASQGTMNNMTVGGWDARRQTAFTYYETIGGGMGARPWADGPSAVHSHMTNTLNTPVEALEFAYPLRVHRYEIRRGSGGKGLYRGGNGIRRDLEMLVDTQVSLITERRQVAPYGLSGGGEGQCGENILIRDGVEKKLRGKGIYQLKSGDVLSIRTPGGGGYGDLD